MDPQDAEHDVLVAFAQWVEQGKAPDRLIATAFQNGDPTKAIVRQGPIYPYPKFPHYRGGDPNHPASYEGVDHAKETPGPAARYQD